jgi:hypothetical protein
MFKLNIHILRFECSVNPSDLSVNPWSMNARLVSDVVMADNAGMCMVV